MTDDESNGALAAASRLLAVQVDALRLLTSRAVVLERLKSDHGRASLYGALEFLIDDAKVASTDREWVLRALYLAVIGDAATADELHRRHVADLFNPAFEQVVRSAAVETRDAKLRGLPSMRLAAFLKTGDTYATWTETRPAALRK